MLINSVVLLGPIIRPHRSTRPTYVDAAYCYRRSSVVCRSVCQSVTIVRPAKTAEPIEMPFGGMDSRGPKEDGGGAHWRHLENTTEPSTCGGYVAFLSNYREHLLLLSLLQRTGIHATKNARGLQV